MAGDKLRRAKFRCECHRVAASRRLSLHRAPGLHQRTGLQGGYCVIDFGANDSKHPNDGSLDATNAVDNWQHKSDFTGDYTEMIAAFRRVNPAARIFICNPTPDFPGRWGINDKTIREKMIPMIRVLADETGVSVIDLHSALAGKSDLFPETVHPNDEGTMLMAAENFRALTGRALPEERVGDGASAVAQRQAKPRHYNLFSPYFAWNNNFSG